MPIKQYMTFTAISPSWTEGEIRTLVVSGLGQDIALQAYGRERAFDDAEKMLEGIPAEHLEAIAFGQMRRNSHQMRDEGGSYINIVPPVEAIGIYRRVMEFIAGNEDLLVERGWSACELIKYVIGEAAERIDVILTPEGFP